MTEKDGFSVVAATRMIQPFSTPGRSASCWAFVNRWISSRNSTVVSPYRSRDASACSMTSRTSFTPAVTAESSTNFRSDSAAIAFAMVVFPRAGRTPEDHGRGAARTGALGGEGAQRRARSEQMALTDDLASSERGRMRTASGVAPRGMPALCSPVLASMRASLERGGRQRSVRRRCLRRPPDQPLGRLSARGETTRPPPNASSGASCAITRRDRRFTRARPRGVDVTTGSGSPPG